MSVGKKSYKELWFQNRVLSFKNALLSNQSAKSPLYIARIYTNNTKLNQWKTLNPTSPPIVATSAFIYTNSNNPIQSNQNWHNLGNKKWPWDSREKAWTQLCWIKMRREFLTCWGVSSVYRITCWSVKGPLRRRFSHTFCIFFKTKKNKTQRIRYRETGICV